MKDLSISIQENSYKSRPRAPIISLVHLLWQSQYLVMLATLKACGVIGLDTWLQYTCVKSWTVLVLLKQETPRSYQLKPILKSQPLPNLITLGYLLQGVISHQVCHSYFHLTIISAPIQAMVSLLFSDFCGFQNPFLNNPVPSPKNWIFLRQIIEDGWTKLSLYDRQSQECETTLQVQYPFRLPASLPGLYVVFTVCNLRSFTLCSIFSGSM